ncbi:tetratricopeptide repeat protein [Sphaerochaeta sp. PS]|jgi:TolA-binding protein|uniref:tetratricopeptide repeat protein n=1 Tax=Sphaerochaeta sp. PS TaxID=3076336 RepID=UPI0028A32CCC|nr:tetratricopeptide repeat protein [Sphaerochaeta sp. PS]MDT4761462.1 tetratricopeptide repeat protein [Sphaerochaeta sp. PS]
MSNKKKVETDLTLNDRLEGSLDSLLNKNKKVLIIVLAVLTIVLITLGVVSAVSKSNLHKQFDQIDLLEETYTAIQAMDTEDATYQAKYDELVSGLQSLSSKKANYPALKAEYLLGMVSFEKKEYQKALDSFMAVYGKAKATYLGSLALSNAAAAAEELNDNTLALEYYTKLIDEFGFSSAEAPKALFGQARLQEKSGNMDLAKATFQQLADQFPSSEYGKLAQNRVALL